MYSNNVIKTVVGQLHENNHVEEVLLLEKYLRSLESKDAEVRKVSAEEIRGLCNARALGDLYIENLDYNEWNMLLVELEKYVYRKAGLVWSISGR